MGASASLGGLVQLSYAALALLALAQLTCGVRRPRRLLSIHTGFLALCCGWAGARLALEWGWALRGGACGVAALTGAAGVLYAATYGLLTMFLATLSASCARHPPLATRATHPRALVHPPAYGAAGVAGSVPDSDVAESPYMATVLGPAVRGGGGVGRADGPTPADLPGAPSPPSRGRPPLLYGAFLLLLAVATAAVTRRSCSSPAPSPPALIQAPSAAGTALCAGLLLHFAIRLRPFPGAARLRYLAYTAGGVGALRSCWAIAYFWLPPALVDTGPALPPGQAPPPLHALATLLAAVPLWAVLLFFRREEARHEASLATASAALTIQATDPPLLPNSTSYGHGPLKLPRASLPPLEPRTGPILHASRLINHEAGWTASLSTYDSLDAESFLPTSLTGPRSAVSGVGHPLV